MYRYQNMIEEFRKMPEFIGYEMDYTILKSLKFEYKEDNEIYYISVEDGCFWEPKILKLCKESKSLIRKNKNDNIKLYNFITEIEKIIEMSNEPYKIILPGYKHKYKNHVFQIQMMVELFEDHKTYPIQSPKELELIINIYDNEEKFLESKRVSFINISNDKNKENWRILKKGGSRNMRNNKNKEFEECINGIVEFLNYKYRLVNLLTGGKN